jgi:glycosyltransferase involved in cell wall biosynthesis
MPKISIIVPVYNTEKYLRPCLDSILAQTFGDFEAILVDDGSKDKCGDICDEYAERDKRIRLYRKNHLGVSNARNFGIKMCNGTYVCFIDSDDYIHPKMLETLHSAVEENNCAFSMCLEQNVDKINPYEEIITEEGYSYEMIDKSDCIYGISHEGKDKRHFVHMVGKLYRKELIEQLKFDESISLSEDLLFNFQFYLKDVCGIRIMKPLYYRTIRSNSLSSIKATDMIYNTGIYQRCLQLLPLTETLNRSYIVLNIMNRIIKFRRRNRKTEYKELAKIRGKELFESIRYEFWKNRNISIGNKIKLTICYYIS